MFSTASLVTPNPESTKIGTYYLSTDVMKRNKDTPVFSKAPFNESVWRSEGIALRILNFSSTYK